MGVVGTLRYKTNMDNILDILESLGEELENIGRKVGLDSSPARLEDKTTYRYHTELGMTVVVVLIILVITAICLFMKARKRKHLHDDDRNNLLEVEAPDRDHVSLFSNLA